MAPSLSKSLSLSRRALLQASAATAGVPSQSASKSPVHPHRFESWETERAEVELLADHTPEIEELLRRRLHDRSFELESLIFATPCLELPAIRVKARLLLWLMEMEDSDGLDAMRHIHAYLHRKA
jgi:hypothetical protein